MRNYLLTAIVLGHALLAPPAVSAEWVAVPFFGNVGGLNDGTDPTAIADNEAADIQNFIFDSPTASGSISKRMGFSQVNTTTLGASVALTGLTYFALANGTEFLVALSDNDAISKMDYTAVGGTPDGTWDGITGTLVFNAGVNDQADFAAAENTLIIEDGIATTAPYRWTGTGNAAALGGSSPNATMVEYHKRHMFAAGDSTLPSTVSASNFDDVQTWTATDTILIETNDGSIIRALKSGLDALYIWKDRSIWRVSGTNRDDFVLEQMVSGTGTLSNLSVVNINNQFVFVTDQCKIAVYDGGINVTIISEKINGTIDGLAFDRCDEAVATKFQDDYYVSLSVAGSATHNRLLMYDTKYRAWTKFTGMTANALTAALYTGEEQLVFGNYAGRAMRYPNTNADDGSAISAYYLTKQFSFPQIPQDKVFRVVETFVNQEGTYNLTMYARGDFESPGTAFAISLAGSGALYDTAVYDVDSYADLTTLIGRNEIEKQRRFLQLRYENVNASQPVTIRGWQVFLESTGRI